MVPLDAFSTDAPHSSIAFCSGCVAGTQCDSLSWNVLSWAAAGSTSAVSAALINTARNFIKSSLCVRPEAKSQECLVLVALLVPDRRPIGQAAVTEPPLDTLSHMCLWPCATGEWRAGRPRPRTCGIHVTS